MRKLLTVALALFLWLGLTAAPSLASHCATGRGDTNEHFVSSWDTDGDPTYFAATVDIDHMPHVNTFLGQNETLAWIELKDADPGATAKARIGWSWHSNGTIRIYKYLRSETGAVLADDRISNSYGAGSVTDSRLSVQTFTQSGFRKVRFIVWDNGHNLIDSTLSIPAAQGGFDPTRVGITWHLEDAGSQFGGASSNRANFTDMQIDNAGSGSFDANAESSTGVFSDMSWQYNFTTETQQFWDDAC